MTKRTKDTLGDLNSHLFAELERLGDEDLKGEELKEELAKARGLALISGQIIQNANTILAAAKFQDGKLDADSETPRLLLGDE